MKRFGKLQQLGVAALSFAMLINSAPAMATEAPETAEYNMEEEIPESAEEQVPVEEKAGDSTSGGEQSDQIQPDENAAEDGENQEESSDNNTNTENADKEESNNWIEVEVSETEETVNTDNIASGVDGDLTWVIDGEGNLTITGSGDYEGSADWLKYSYYIKTAKVEVSNITTTKEMFYHCSDLVSIDLSGTDTSNVEDMQYMFDNCTSLKSLNVSNFDTSNVTDMSGMFAGCKSLTSLSVSSFNTGKVQNMRCMFYKCSSLTSLYLIGLNMSTVQSMDYMFYGCSSLIYLYLVGLNTSNVQNMASMFYGCSSLTTLNLSGLNTSNVQNMDSMFYGCSSLTSLDLSKFDTGNVVKMGLLFNGCSSLTSVDLSSFNTNNVQQMQYMFYGCSSLTSVDLSNFDTGNVIYMNEMFYSCTSLTSVDLSSFDVGNVQSTQWMFYNCTNLKSLDLSSFHAVNNKDMQYMFYRCSSLTSLNLSGFDTGNVKEMEDLFSGCSSLKSLDLSSFDTTNVTIMDAMFSNCTSLTSVDLSSFDTSNVKRIEYMFRGCNNLSTSIILRSNSYSYYTNCFYEAATSPDAEIHVQYADSCTEDIAQKIVDTKSENSHVYLDGAYVSAASSRLAASTDTTRLTIYKNLNKSTDKADSYVLCPQAEVSVAGITYISDENGIVEIPTQTSGSITVSLADYITRSLTVEQYGQSTDIYLEQINTDGPVITALWYDTNVDILKETSSLSMISENEITLKAEIDWGISSYGKICLLQEQRMLNFDDGSDSVTTTISDNFDTSSSIYIVVTDADGRTTKRKLLFSNGSTDKVLNELSGASFTIGDKISLTLPDNIQPSIFAGTKISANVLSTNLPITISAENGKVYVAIGVDLTLYSYSDKWASSTETGNKAHVLKTKTFIDNFKAANIIGTNASSIKKFANLCKTYQNAMKYPQGSFGFNADFTILGFAEGTYDDDGNIAWLDSGMVINPSVSASWSQGFALGPVPMYVEASISGDVLGQLNLIFDEQAKNFIPNGEISGSVSISGGAGAGVKKVLYAGGGIKGSLKPDWKIVSDGTDYFTLKASVNFYAKAGIACFEYSYNWDPVYDEVWLEYPDMDSISTTVASATETVNADGSEGLLQLENYEVKCLDYLDGESEFTINEDTIEETAETLLSDQAEDDNNEAEEFMSNVYKETTPNIVTLSDGRQLAVWMNSSSSDINTVYLYYSICTDGTWSDPAVVYEDGTMDYEPTLKMLNGTAYLAWQNASQAFTDTSSLTLDDIAGAFDVSVATFDLSEGTFRTTTLNYDKLDILPTLCADGSSVYVTWVNNAENSWFGDNNQNSIVYSRLEDGNWSSPAVLYEGLNSIDSISADAVEEGGLKVAYSMDTDGDITTYEDVRVYESGIQVSADVSSYTPVYYNHKLYWISNRNVVTADNSASEGAINANDYQILEVNGETAMLFTVSDGLNSTLMISYYNAETDTWGTGTALTNGEGFIGAFSASVNNDGTVKVLLNNIAVTGTYGDENPYGEAALCMISVGTCTNLSIDNIYYAEDSFCAGKEMPFTLAVTNKGNKTVNKYTVQIKDENGTLLSTVTSNNAIVPGETREVMISYKIGTNVSSQNIVISVSPDSDTDTDLTDNTETIQLTYEKTKIENLTYGYLENGKISISADIVNRGYTAQQNLIVSLRKETADGTVIDSRTIDSLDSLKVFTASFEVTAAKNEVFYIVVESDEEMQDSDFLSIYEGCCDITSQPEDISVMTGEKFIFAVEAESTKGSTLSYLWQYSKDGGETWIDTTRTKDNFSTTATTAMNGRMFRCLVTDASGNSVLSDAATLTVKPAIEITSQTDAQTVNVGELYRFRVTAVSNTGSKLTYLWQYSKTLKGWTDTTRTVNNYGTYATVGVDGKYFRCKITDEAGNVVYSTPAMVRVLSDITITSQPTDTTVASGKRFYFTVTATGSSLTYLWQYSADGGQTWIDTTRARNNYTTYAKKGMDGRMFRCVITDSSNNTVISEAGTLTVK